MDVVYACIVWAFNDKQKYNISMLVLTVVAYVFPNRIGIFCIPSLRVLTLVSMDVEYEFKKNFAPVVGCSNFNFYSYGCCLWMGDDFEGNVDEFEFQSLFLSMLPMN